MNNTKKFYDNLMDNKSDFTFFTKDTRFNVEKLLKKKNIKIHFDNLVKNFISPNDVILDYGCGPGTFSIKLSYLTKNKIFGVDISENFIKECENLKKKLKIKNFFPKHISENGIPFKDNTFDVILLFDVIHHLSSIEKNFHEINRVLKKGGKLIIYEPNKLNPIIALLHYIDPIERGLLKVGTKKKYYKFLKEFKFKIMYHKYSGIVVGPNSYIFNFISWFLNIKLIYKILGWLNPKIFIVAEK